VARIFGPSSGGAPVAIDKDAIKQFFEQRAKKAEVVGQLSAVIYQDKNPALAVERDRAEKALLVDKIIPRRGLRILDLGCGNGRWAGELLKSGCIYHGVDGSAGLIAQARAKYAGEKNASFDVVCAERISADVVGAGFERILVFGLLVYLNDEDVVRLAANLSDIAAEHCRLLLREPMGIAERLTITDHFSTDMDQFYSAIYRTEAEILDMLAPLLDRGFRSVGSGDLFDNASLNNRVETRQRWMILERWG
jgi:SAM-dependent methyltransferase